MAAEHVDVLIVGAGISGVGAAHHLQERCPGKTYAIFEARGDLGGTWDLFRYPGIRSDSDMHTLGYRFKPWTDAQAIADGPSILDYVRETARESGAEERIRYHHRVVSAEWSTPDSRWTVEAERTDTGETVRITCDFLLMCSGYFRYDRGYTPEFPGIERFAGQVVHPQLWPDDLDYAGKRVLVIGSGATAVTLVPAMAETAGHVTMLQRSPTYVISLPGEDRIANALRRVLPNRWVYAIVRWKNVLLQMASYQLSRRRPKLMKDLIRRAAEKALPPGYDIDRHFNPRYDPWDQRLCLVPDGDLFEAISAGRAEIVTDTIETFTESGVKLDSGEELEADIVITATGLELLFLGGIEVTIDGEDADLPSRMTYKGMMLSDIPNLAFNLGYSNASWTLKVDLTCEYVCRLLNHMDENGYTRCVPRANGTEPSDQPLVTLTSGYVMRALDRLPKQGPADPWQLRQNYAFDLRALRRGPLVDSAMEFSTPSAEPGPAEPAEPAEPAVA
jgi:cation diffusion facilitator CzcD-associated flavoprotein CzcO